MLLQQFQTIFSQETAGNDPNKCKNSGEGCDEQNGKEILGKVTEDYILTNIYAVNKRKTE